MAAIYVFYHKGVTMIHRSSRRVRGFSWLASVALVLALVICVAGCGKGGPKPVRVSGQVLVDGQPLVTGVPGYVRVIPAEGRPATGAIDPQTGKFSLMTFKEGDGCIPGTHKVAVIVRHMVGSESVSLIPEKYAEPASSGLSVTIDGPTDSLEINLSGPVVQLPPGAVAPISDDPNKF